MTDPPEGLKDLSWELPRNFMGLEGELGEWEKAGAVVVPVPYEATVSYQGGTKAGPAAILEASRYLELYDQELDGEPAEIGIATLPSLHLTSAGPEAAIRELRDACARIYEEAGERFVVYLGGEHSITSAPVLSLAERMPDKRLTVLQFDAHSDLRREYEGSPFSHAAVMAQVADVVDIVAVGIRALTTEEREWIRTDERITTIFAEEMWRDLSWIDRAMEAIGEDVYITFDVDYFDPALVPATGTPEPGGPGWYPTLELLRRVFRERTVHAADIVELAPQGGNAAPDFLVAKLLYKMVGYHWDALGRPRASS
jgi:agmatinase